MSHAHLDQLIANAVAEGLLPPESTRPPEELRPWPVILLTALGAWLAAIPLISIFFLALNGVLRHGVGPFVVGIPFLLGAVLLLRKRDLPLFVEQLLVPAFLSAMVILAWGMFEQIQHNAAAALFGILACAVAAAVDRRWLRVLLGALACAMWMFTLMPKYGFHHGGTYWLALHAALLLWIAVTLRARAALPHALAIGWGAAVLAGLAMYAGMTFLAGGQVGDSQGELWRIPPQPWDSVVRAGSVLMTAAGAAWIVRRWPSQRTAWNAAAMLVLLGLAWLMPSLGGALLILAVSAGTRGWRLAGAAGMAAAWIIGAFYYQAAYPLQTKAVWLIVAGALLAAIARFGWHGPQSVPTPPAVPRRDPLVWGIALCALAVLAVANIGIWQKEALIAEGRPIFVELAPVDPRSLMQGDYMALRYRSLPDVLRKEPDLPVSGHPHVIARIDARGIATLVRMDAGKPLAPGELSIELTHSNSGWELASDAWYFREGEGERWARAKYAEFRVDRAGHALLVGMRGPALETL